MTIQPKDIITPTSVTLIRKDPRPNLPPGLSAKQRIESFIQAISLVNSTRRHKDKFRTDVTTGQRVVYDYEYTEQAVVDGEALTDSSKRKPVVFAFQGIITETPFIPYTLGDLGGLPFLSRVVEYMNQLVAMAENREPLFVASSIFVNPNMVIKSLSIEKNPRTGQAVEVRLAMSEIRRVSGIKREPIPDDQMSQLGINSVVTGTGSSSGARSG